MQQTGAVSSRQRTQPADSAWPRRQHGAAPLLGGAVLRLLRLDLPVLGRLPAVLRLLPLVRLGPRPVRVVRVGRLPAAPGSLLLLELHDAGDAELEPPPAADGRWAR